MTELLFWGCVWMLSLFAIAFLLELIGVFKEEYDIIVFVSVVLVTMGVSMIGAKWTESYNSNSIKKTEFKYIDVIPQNDTCYYKNGKVLLKDIGYMSPDSVYIDNEATKFFPGNPPAVYMKKTTSNLTESAILFDESYTYNILYIKNDYCCHDVYKLD